MRLTTEEAGFLDATPIEPGILVNFVIHHEEIGSAVEYAEKFWLRNRTQDRQRDRFCAAVHALFLSQNPQYLQFERFFYLYVTLDACFSMLWGTKSAKKKPSHAERTRWMCERLKIPVPAGATPGADESPLIAALRNDAIHEGLFASQPLGFAIIEEDGSNLNLTLEMVDILGVSDREYLESPVNNRMTNGLRLT